MNARQREKEIAARRALALRKLAKVFGANGGDRGAGAYTAERQILLEILRTTSEPDVVALVRDRLAVIAEDAASTPSDSDDDKPPPPADVPEVKSRFSSAWTVKALRDIAKGTRRVPSALATGAFWEDLVAAEAPELAHLRATGRIRDDAPVRDDVAGTAAAPPREPLWRGLDDDEGRRIRAKLRQDGYAQCPRPEAFEDDPSRLARDAWTDALGGETTLDDLADAMDALRVAGWPPIGVYAFDATWTVVDRLFEVAEAALGTRDVALEPSCFAWALRARPAESPVKNPPEGARDAARAADAVGANFPLPHRDYSAREAWTTTSTDRRLRGDAGEPTLLCVWMPLTDATLDTGCLHVLPRGADRTWDDPDHPDHLRPAEREPGGGAAVRFSLADVRALPAEAGSVCAWAGQTVHWGGSCRLREDDDAYEGENPTEEGLVKIRHARGLPDPEPRRLPRRARPRRSLACTFRKASAGEFACGGALPLMTRAECAALDVAGRVRLIAQSLVLYSRWYDLPAFLPGVLEDGEGFEGGATLTAKATFQAS